MEVGEAGLGADACQLLCQDCWAFRFARVCRLRGRRGSSSGSH
jgi:hypothetical protein